MLLTSPQSRFDCQIPLHTPRRPFRSHVEGKRPPSFEPLQECLYASRRGLTPTQAPNYLPTPPAIVIGHSYRSHVRRNKEHYSHYRNVYMLLFAAQLSRKLPNLTERRKMQCSQSRKGRQRHQRHMARTEVKRTKTPYRDWNRTLGH